MPRIRHSSSERTRVRLISTPNPEGALVATSTVHGVKFSDQLAALLDHVAATDGWRVEPNNHRLGAGVTIYAPDKSISPIHVSERGAKFNRPHYENIRRDLYRAGLPPLPADTKPTTPAQPIEETPMPATKTKPTRTAREMREIDALLAPGADDRPNVLAGIVDGLFTKAEDLAVFGDLAAGLTYAVASWAESAAEGLTQAAITRARADAAKEIEEALKMAADAEAKATRLETALQKADTDTKKAREDCRDALRRAEAAEAEAAELRGALAPLRALLSATDK